MSKKVLKGILVNHTKKEVAGAEVRFYTHEGDVEVGDIFTVYAHSQLCNFKVKEIMETAEYLSCENRGTPLSKVMPVLDVKDNGSLDMDRYKTTKEALAFVDRQKMILAERLADAERAKAVKDAVKETGDKSIAELLKTITDVEANPMKVKEVTGQSEQD